MSNLGTPFALDGASRFQFGQTYTDLPDRSKAEKLIRTLANICGATMKRNHLTIRYLIELPPHYTTAMADNCIEEGGKDTYGHYSIAYIRIMLRDPQNPAKFLPLEVLLYLMCHELAHCWHLEHFVSFIKEWKRQMDQMERDLVGTYKIQRDPPHALVHAYWGKALKLQQ